MVQDAEKLSEWRALREGRQEAPKLFTSFVLVPFSTVRFADKASPPLHHQYLLISKLDRKDAKYSSGTGTP